MGFGGFLNNMVTIVVCLIIAVIIVIVGIPYVAPALTLGLNEIIQNNIISIIALIISAISLYISYTKFQQSNKPYIAVSFAGVGGNTETREVNTDENKLPINIKTFPKTIY